MKTYADTSFLVSLYVEDVHTESASAWMLRRAGQLPFTPLHRHEFRNAIRLAVRRKQIDEAKRREFFRLIEDDLKAGFLKHHSVEWSQAFREAERIGELQTEQTGVRSADLLHIGIAFASGAQQFLTFNATQRAAATAIGLKCVF